MRSILSVFLAVVLALSPVPVRADADWQEMVYVHYDPEPFYTRLDRLDALADGSDAQAALDLYDGLYAQLVHMETLSSLAYIHYSDDVTDSYWSEETVYSRQQAVQAADALTAVCHDLMAGPCAGAFADHVGPDAAQAFADYVPMTSRERALADREAELVDAYYEGLNAADGVTYTYTGRTWDLEMISSLPGISLAQQDYEGYLEVFYGLQEQVNALLGPIYTELVALRAEQAQLRGYASYTDLVYERTYGRDYTGAEAQALCDAVKPIGRAYYGGVGHSGTWDDADAVWPQMGAVELMDMLGRYVVQIDPALAEPWRYMTDHGLCRLTDGPDRLPSSYTAPLREYGTAFVFVGLTGTCADLGTLAHEFGHFANACRHPAADLLTGVGSYDLMEVHSTGLEALFTAFYDDIFTAGADTARAAALADLIEAVLDGCIQDEFQRRVYAQPDMGLDEIDRLYADICAQYGRNEPTGVDYGWMYIHHNFESPLYYISYAVSALAAIQIWDLAREDFAAGAAAWAAVLDHDACRESYADVMTACGLRPFTEPGAASDICLPLLDELARLASDT